MKKLLTSLITLLFVNAFSQAPSFSFAKEQSCWAVDTKIDTNGDIISVGYFNGVKDFDPSATTYTLSDADGSLYMQKLNSNGNLIWAKNFGPTAFSSTENVINSLQIAANNDYVICGTYIGNGDFNPGTAINTLTCQTDNTNIFIARFDENGNLIWANGIGAIGSTNDERAQSISIDNNDNLIVVGSFQNFSPNFTDFDPSASTYTVSGGGGNFVAKYSSNGSFISVKKFQGLNHQYVFSYPNNDVLVLGYTQGVEDYDPSPTNTYTINTTYPGSYSGQTYYLRLNSNLDFISAKAISGGSINKFTSASVSSSLTALMCTIDCAGATTDSDPSSTVTTTLNTHFSTYGKMIQRLDGDMNLLFAKNVKKDYNASFTNGTDNFSNVKDTLIKYDNAGNTIWKYKTTNAMPVSIIRTPLDNLYVSGFNLGNANCDPMTNDPNGLLGASEGYLFRWDLPITTNIYTLEGKISDISIFPNPAKNYINISSKDFITKTEIINVLGEQIKQQKNEMREIIMSIDDLNSGIYFLKADGKMIRFVKE
ncbi:MAG: T9SS type A sorting domain-containing protein [Bacteroidia bacterium]|nr:T9SS type A sorting domain-containing protein [Bacteroidia bacterium]